jgi:hypothetical protein
LRSFLLLVYVTCASFDAIALSYSPEAFLSWEEMVAESEFVGIIECVRSGVVVSEFKVVETWKGKIAEPTFRLVDSPRVGDRYMVGLRPFVPFEYSPTAHLYTLMFRNSPLEIWTEAPATHSSVDPLSRGIVRIDPDRLVVGGTFGYREDWRSVSRFKSDSLAVVESKGEKLEALLIVCALRSLVKESTVVPQSLDVANRGESGLDSVLAAMLDPQAGIDPEAVRWALRRAGGEATLAKLEAWPFPFQVDADWLADVVQGLQNRPRPEVSSPYLEDSYQIDESEALEADKEWLKKPVDSEPSIDLEQLERWCSAVERLTAKQPEYIAEFLKSLDTGVLPEELKVQIPAIWFATNCPKDRTACLRILSTSSNTTIRAIGAAFLAFEDPLGGLSALEQLASEKGPNEHWAVCMLVAHGKKAYVPRALEGYLGDSPESITQWLVDPYLPVLSNAAADADLPQPGGPYWREVDVPNGRERLVAWWAEYGDRMTLKPLAYHWLVK